MIKRLFVFVVLTGGFTAFSQTNTFKVNTNGAVTITNQQKKASIQEAAAAQKQATLQQSAYVAGWKSGKDYKETGGTQINPDYTPMFVMRHSYPKLEKFPELTEAYRKGFMDGWRNATSISASHPYLGQKRTLKAVMAAEGVVVDDAPHVFCIRGYGNTLDEAEKDARGQMPIDAREIHIILQSANAKSQGNFEHPIWAEVAFKSYQP
jgi:hypothetical protein